MLRQLHWRSLGSACVQVAVLAVLALAFFMRTPQVFGLSMAPHIASGEIVLINTMSYRFGAPGRGDIIAFRHDGPTPQIFIKRIIGVPGDHVRIDLGRVFVNGTPLNEPYVQYPDVRSFPDVIVPADSLYVLGDNRAASDDSRFWGFVPRRDVLGKALAGIWPLGHFGAL
ncbi:MAG TPA: signal peptidase I [Candidatus Baltobacteraceae bacterium]|nr:signal peptidase I [Candidatus Baltobacteraceae bacterium]